MDLTPLRSIPNHNIKPDPDNPNHYCKSCNFQRASPTKYKKHLFHVHNVRSKPVPNHDIEPDPHDPNFDCKSCDHNYLSRQGYKRHLRLVHKIIWKPL
jgi:hypothetical protein